MKPMNDKEWEEFQKVVEEASWSEKLIGVNFSVAIITIKLNKNEKIR